MYHWYQETSRQRYYIINILIPHYEYYANDNRYRFLVSANYIIMSRLFDDQMGVEEKIELHQSVIR